MRDALRARYAAALLGVQDSEIDGLVSTMARPERVALKREIDALQQWLVEYETEEARCFPHPHWRLGNEEKFRNDDGSPHRGAVRDAGIGPV